MIGVTLADGNLAQRFHLKLLILISCLISVYCPFKFRLWQQFHCIDLLLLVVHELVECKILVGQQYCFWIKRWGPSHNFMVN
jgi:hypothetical protein